MIVACQNQIWDQIKPNTGSKTPKLLRHRYLAEILGNRTLYSLRKSKRIEKSNLLIQGVNLSVDRDSSNTVDNSLPSKAQSSSRTSQPRGRSVRLQIKTETQDNTTLIENRGESSKFAPDGIRGAFRTCRQNQTRICNLQFKVENSENQRLQSIQAEGGQRRNTLTNHKLKLKTLENRLINRYYTIQLSHLGGGKKDVLKDISITKYQNLQLSKLQPNLQGLWD